MLKKLLKYDLKYMLKAISIFYILAVFFAILTRILFSLEQTIIVNIIGQITVGCMFSMLASTLINTLMRSWVRFKDSIYGDESYLTHTLPVTKGEIYESKFLLTIIYSFISFIVVIISLFIAYYNKENWAFLKELINGFSTSLNVKTVPFIISFLLVIFLEIFNIIQAGFLGLILGHRMHNNRIAFSVLFGFLIYLAAQTIILILIFVVGLFNSSIMSLFTSNIVVDNSVMKLMLILTIILYFIMISCVNLICVKMLKKGVNVE